MTTHLDSLLPALTFRLTRDDWAAFERLPAELLGWEKLFVFGPPVAVGMLVAGFDETWRALLPLSLDGFVGKLLLAGGLLALAYGVSTLMLSLRTRRRIARRPLPATDTTIDSDLHNVVVTENGAPHKHAWTDLTVIETATHVFLCPAPRAAIILPLRAFDGPEAMHLYAHTARELGVEEADLP
jgi:hypothetical protein